MNLLITGAAGFIGYHLAIARLEAGDDVMGFDNLNDYYDVRLKYARLENLKKYPGFQFIHGDISDLSLVHQVFDDFKPQRVAHLAAQAGVRYSLSHPHVYVQSNVVGFTHILDACRQHQVEHLVYASSSSVYGANAAQPYQEGAGVDHPMSIYAATKKANELIAHTYSNLYQLPTTGLRFFTVYGPWGRPDMAFFSFTKNILEGLPIQVYNHGNMQRDFTYIDDIVKGISLVIDKPAAPNQEWSADNPDPASSFSPYRIYNIGGGRSVKLLDYIHAIEQAAGKKAIIEFMPLQEGDVLSTHADTRRLQHDFAFSPSIGVDEGVARFVHWYKEFYNIQVRGSKEPQASARVD